MRHLVANRMDNFRSNSGAIWRERRGKLGSLGRDARH